MNDGSLSTAQRAEALGRLAAEEFDLLVIGGGVTGAGTALDAVTRGLSVALVEKGDYAAGTSSRSSKLLHGGLRYLEQRDFALVREALHERGLILSKLAPHLARRVPFLYPLQNRWERAYAGTGVALYDVLSGVHSAVPRHRHVSKQAALRLSPALRGSALTGAVRYYDAQVDDARFVLAVLRTAVAHGAALANGLAATGVTMRHGRVAGVTLWDAEGGSEIQVRARVVVNATGVWAPEVERMAGVPDPLRVRASKGVHLLVPQRCIDSATALILRTDRSVLFVIPWDEHWIVGTTDTPYDLGLDEPAVDAADVRYLLDQVNRVLHKPLSETDVVGVYAGLRPLVEPPDSSGAGSDTTRISREHIVRRSAPGLVTVAGGKFTTYRVMARDTVDLAAEDLGAPVEPSCTENVPLLGAVGLGMARHRAASHAGSTHMAPGVLDRLIRRYGTAVHEILDLIAADPELASPLVDGMAYLAAEVVHATVHEGALHVDDVLTRRTRVSIEAEDRGHGAAAVAAALMAPYLGWDAARQNVEIERYRERVNGERVAIRVPAVDLATV